MIRHVRALSCPNYICKSRNEALKSVSRSYLGGISNMVCKIDTNMSEHIMTPMFKVFKKKKYQEKYSLSSSQLLYQTDQQLFLTSGYLLYAGYSKLKHKLSKR
jgi:hypothetical protein